MCSVVGVFECCPTLMTAVQSRVFSAVKVIACFYISHCSSWYRYVKIAVFRDVTLYSLVDTNLPYNNLSFIEDPRVLKPKGYSPRRSASGSSRMEMYFPEVDVDVLQHGSSRPREPTIPLR